MSVQKSKPKSKRPVDQAMLKDRPAKLTIRKLWIDKAREFNESFPNKNELLYLSLCGEEGREFKLLAKHGIIELTETGALAPEYLSRVAAIESHPQAVAKLAKCIHGLKIYEASLHDLLRGNKMTRFPKGDEEQAFKARVINLDLNGLLVSKEDEAEFPFIIWIKKISLIQATENPKREWALFLTFNGEIVWSKEVCSSIQSFLSENFNAVKEFSEKSELVLGHKLHERILSEKPMDFSGIPPEHQQKILNIFVPKKLSNALSDEGWKIETSHNLRYGGEKDGNAPMVTWIFDFKKDERSTSKPGELYHENLISITENIGKINVKGEIEAHA